MVRSLILDSSATDADTKTAPSSSVETGESVTSVLNPVSPTPRKVKQARNQVFVEENGGAGVKR